jgi:hypothetical protein
MPEVVGAMTRDISLWNRYRSGLMGAWQLQALG